MQIGSWTYQPKWISSLIVVCLLVLLCALGNWQAGRSQEKRQLAERFDQGSADVVLQVRTDTEVEKFSFRRVQMTGNYIASRQFLLDNRTQDGVAGYNVLTPLMLGTSDVAVLVNRGWVPIGESRERLPDIVVSADERTVHGALSPAPRVFLLGDAGHGVSDWPRVVQSVDWEAMQAALGVGVLPAQVLLSDDEPDGYQRTWTPYYGITPERHKAYAVQWYALAATLFVLYTVASVKRIRKPGNQ